MKDNSKKDTFITESETPVLTNKSENEIEL